MIKCVFLICRSTSTDSASHRLKNIGKIAYLQIFQLLTLFIEIIISLHHFFHSIPPSCTPLLISLNLLHLFVIIVATHIYVKCLSLYSQVSVVFTPHQGKQTDTIIQTLKLLLLLLNNTLQNYLHTVYITLRIISNLRMTSKVGWRHNSYPNIALYMELSILRRHIFVLLHASWSSLGIFFPF